MNCYYNKISYCKYISKGNGLGISLTLKLSHKLKVSNAAIIFDMKFSYSVVLFRGVFSFFALRTQYSFFVFILANEFQ